MNSSFGYTTSLRHRLRAADAELQAFRSGKKYLDMEEQHQKTVRALERRIKELEKELATSLFKTFPQKRSVLTLSYETLPSPECKPITAYLLRRETA